MRSAAASLVMTVPLVNFLDSLLWHGLAYLHRGDVRGFFFSYFVRFALDRQLTIKLFVAVGSSGTGRRSTTKR